MKNVIIAENAAAAVAATNPLPRDPEVSTVVAVVVSVTLVSEDEEEEVVSEEEVPEDEDDDDEMLVLHGLLQTPLSRMSVVMTQHGALTASPLSTSHLPSSDGVKMQ